MVLAGFVTAWRLASWPTRRSPVLVKATTDGTVRPPSADAMTVGSPPSMTATTEFVVPRSIPMILPMSRSAPVGLSGSVDGFCGLVARGGGDHRGPDHPVAEPVAAPQLLDDLAVAAIPRRDVGDRLVLAGIEGQPRRRLDRSDALALEQLPELAVDGGDALDPRVVGDRVRAGVD